MQERTERSVPAEEHDEDQSVPEEVLPGSAPAQERDEDGYYVALNNFRVVLRNPNDGTELVENLCLEDGSRVREEVAGLEVQTGYRAVEVRPL